MHTGGITETIWHFAGLLHIAEEVAKGQLVLDGAPAIHLSGGYSRLLLRDGGAPKSDFGAPESQQFQLDLDLGGPIGVHAKFGPHHDPLPTAKIAASFGGKLAHPPHMKPIGPIGAADYGVEGDAHVHHVLPRFAAGSHAFDSAEPISVSYNYHDGGNDQLVLMHQYNGLEDGDYVQMGSQLALHESDLGPTIARLLDVARSEIPDNYVPHIEAGQSWADFAKSLGGGADHTVAPGRYVNGELQPADAQVPSAHDEAKPLPQQEHPGDTGQVLVAGGNSATNVALIVDTNDASGSLIVLGNHYKTTAIFQTNIYSDSDAVSAGEHDARVATGGDQADNIAALVEKSLGPEKLGTAHGHLDVNVDVINGDYYDINWLKQYNIISDNDVVTFNTLKTFSTMTTGANASANLGQMIGEGKYYDLIIVTGDFYSKNLIYQTNILLDNDVVTLGRLPPDAQADADAHPDAAAKAGGDADAAQLKQDADSGGNVLLNEAKIWTFGSQTVMSVSPEMMDMIKGLQGEGSIDPSVWWQFMRSSSDTFTVGLFKGDYYDVNVIEQTNIVTDEDTAHQLVSAAVQDGQTAITQESHTGGNTLENQAIIIDPGTAFSEHVDGQVYSDSMLIQTNIVDPPADVAVHGDTTAVVPEFVAFAMDDTAHSDANDPHLAQHSATTHADGFGSVLS